MSEHWVCADDEKRKKDDFGWWWSSMVQTLIWVTLRTSLSSGYLSLRSNHSLKNRLQIESSEFWIRKLSKKSGTSFRLNIELCTAETQPCSQGDYGMASSLIGVSTCTLLTVLCCDHFGHWSLSTFGLFMSSVKYACLFWIYACLNPIPAWILSKAFLCPVLASLDFWLIWFDYPII